MAKVGIAGGARMYLTCHHKDCRKQYDLAKLVRETERGTQKLRCPSCGKEVAQLN